MRFSNFTAAAVASLSLFSAAQAQDLREPEAPVCEEFADAQFEERVGEARGDVSRSGAQCSVTADACWYLSGCAMVANELTMGSGTTPNSYNRLEDLLNGCHKPSLPENCYWTNQVGTVDGWTDGSTCYESAGATGDPGPATGLNSLITDIVNTPVPHGMMISGYDVMGVDPFKPPASAGHVKVHYRSYECFARRAEVPLEAHIPNHLAQPIDN